MSGEIVSFIRKLYETDAPIYLHEPQFNGNEKKYVLDAIDSTFVSSAGAYVDRFEQDFAAYVGMGNAVACVNGTAALHTALILANVEQDDEVITQALTFVATCNAISYQRAHPVFVDVDKDTMGMSPKALGDFLDKNAKIIEGVCINKNTGRVIKAVVPMHTFGHPCRIDEIADLCKKWCVVLIEDAAEALGSSYKGRALGTFGDIAAFSFNGNKVVTTGGGGVIVSRHSKMVKRAKYLTTTAKVPHPFEFSHSEVGYNYRMPNLNAALGCAQLEQADQYLTSKRETAAQYKRFFLNREEIFVDEPEGAESNFWLNAIVLKNRKERDEFLEVVNAEKIMTRPIWTLMNKLPMFESCQCGLLENSQWLEDRVVNLPSSVRP
jgi:perosamine synthetase